VGLILCRDPIADELPALGFTPKKVNAMLKVYLENAIKDRENILAAQARSQGD